MILRLIKIFWLAYLISKLLQDFLFFCPSMFNDTIIIMLFMFQEVESRILKAMQPDLCLNPKPVQGIFRGESMTKKVLL